MHKGNPEILRFEVALQDFAEFTIVIHNEQMRPELLGRLTGNFRWVRATGALTVHDDSDESLLNQERPAKQSPRRKRFSRPYYVVLLLTIRCSLEPAGHPHSVARLEPPEHPASSPGDAKASVNAAEPTKQEGSSEGVFFWPTAPIEAQTQ